MPNVTKEQLCELKEKGWTVVVPAQGINPVTDGLAATTILT
jgi:hypothetical protein